MPFTIVIQGPLNSTSIVYISNYLEYGKVVLSTLDSSDIKLTSSDIRLICVKTNEYGYNQQNIWKQCITTLEGLKSCRTKYVIKVRSDEYYTDLSKLVNTILKFPNKIVTNDIFFEQDEKAKYHPSDHIIAGKKSNLLAAYKTLKSTLIKYKDKDLLRPRDLLGDIVLNNPYEHLVAEQLFCLSYLQSKKEKITADNSVHLMEKHFVMINSNDLGEYKISCNSCLKD